MMGIDKPVVQIRMIQEASAWKGTTMKLLLSELHGIPTAAPATTDRLSFFQQKSFQVSFWKLGYERGQVTF